MLRSLFKRYSRHKDTSEQETPKTPAQPIPCPWAPIRDWRCISDCEMVVDAIEQFRKSGIRIESITEYPNAGITFISVLGPDGKFERTALRTFKGVYSFTFPSPTVEKYEAVLQQAEQQR